MPNAMLQPGTQTAPRDVFRLRSPMEFAAAGDDGASEHPITMLARSPEPIFHWYWGKIVHDMAGMKLRKDVLPLDYCHWGNEVVGVADSFDASENKGLTVKGKLVSVFAGDRVDEITKKAKAGIPYEASIDFYDEAALKLEWVPEGMSTTVNGRKFEGPGVIAREWMLNGVAVCPQGADPKTKSQFAAGEPDQVQVTLFSESHPMSNNPAPAPATESPEAAFEAKLAKFTARFGETNGTKWALAKKTYEEALELHADALATQLKAAGETHEAALAADKEKHAAELKAATDKTAELETKLAAVDRGEPAPVSGGDGEKPAPAAQKLATKIGDNLAKFAASLKLPGKA